MTDPVGLRGNVVIVTIVVSVVAVSAFGVWAAHTGSQGPCPSLYGGPAYCTRTLTISAWCHWGIPCASGVGNSTELLGYWFHVLGLIYPNGTPSLAVSILGFNNATDYTFEMYPTMFGTPVDWSSPDNSVIFSWPNPVLIVDAPLTVISYVVCGVMAP